MYKTIILVLAMSFYFGTGAEAAALHPLSPLIKRHTSLLALIPASSLPACQSLCNPINDLISPCANNNFTSTGCQTFCKQDNWDALYACIQCNANEAKMEGKLFTPDQAASLRRDQYGIFGNCGGQGLTGREFNLTIAGNAQFQLTISSASHTSLLNPAVLGLGVLALAGVVALL